MLTSIWTSRTTKGDLMARGGSGFRTAIRVAKAIDRAGKQAARDAERRRRQLEREEAQRQREAERRLRDQEKARVAEQKAQIAAEKAQFKKETQLAARAYEVRCQKRKQLTKRYIAQEIK
jgi:preprotein translocase subunit SecD